MVSFPVCGRDETLIMKFQHELLKKKIWKLFWVFLLEHTYKERSYYEALQPKIIVHNLSSGK